jgi:cobalamin synthase
MNALKAAVGLITRFQWAGAAESADGRQVRPLVPVAGAAVGIALAAAGYALLWLAGRGAGTLIGSLLVFGLWWWLTGGRGGRETVALVEGLAPGDDSDVCGLYCRVTVFQLLVLVRIACIGILLYFGQALWLVTVTSLSAAAFSDLCRDPKQSSSQAESDWSGTYSHWAVAAVAALVAAGLCHAFVAGVFGLVVAWLLPATLERLQDSAGTALPHGSTVLIENVLLVLGVVFFMAF